MSCVFALSVAVFCLFGLCSLVLLVGCVSLSWSAELCALLFLVAFFFVS